MPMNAWCLRPYALGMLARLAVLIGSLGMTVSNIGRITTLNPMTVPALRPAVKPVQMSAPAQAPAPTLEGVRRSETEDRLAVVYSRPQPARNIQGLDAQLQGLNERAAEVTLKIKTRTGENLELRVNTGNSDAGQSSGLLADLKRQELLGSGEGKALAQLTEGVEKALAALMRSGGPELDLAGLLGYDRSQFASLSLDVKMPVGEDGALRSFSLHLGAQENRLALATEHGQFQLRVDANSPLAEGDPAQRQQAIANHLSAIEAAGVRGQADERIVDLFKSGFSQMHGLLAEAAENRGSLSSPLRLLPALAQRTQALVSGLADFDASFSSKSQRLNRDGVVTSKSQTDFRLSQKTELDMRRNGDMRVQQVLDTQLTATIMQARNGGMLIPEDGNYDLMRIDDREKQRTVIEAVAGDLVRAVRESDRQQYTHREILKQHRVVDQNTTPDNTFAREPLI
ncbi:hypothetical protein HDN1F_36060 [gamma proteobacterium HdN1]|nr:hypothetical protein HDN1F_36060 [gamma proteobacterium HdN1]